MVWYVTIVSYFWMLLKDWLFTIFIIPFKNTDMLWLLVPVWVSWFFSEFFQEKIGTSMGNALTNTVVVLWGSIDMARQTVRLIGEHVIKGFGSIFLRFSIITLVFAYGATIVVLGIHGNKIIKHIARIREVTYVFVMFVPIFYNAIPLTWNHLIAAGLFFPVYYWVIEFFDRLTPNPTPLTEDIGETPGQAPQMMFRQP
ncbi:hypothetical protein HYU14_03440 [Candidatus Woesearchaeota archaeon]|nr:hypothetical protein [Candidatus Woesearchaeota archaeon]